MIPASPVHLTDQEESLFSMLLTRADGYKQFAAELGTSESATRVCARQIFKKLKVDNRYELLITFLGDTRRREYARAEDSGA